jgi:hypothetical protein
MLWHASAGPQRQLPRGGVTCPMPGTSYRRMINQHPNEPGRWRT